MSYRCGFCSAVVPDGSKQLKVTTYRDRVSQVAGVGPRGYPILVTAVTGREIVSETPACRECHHSYRTTKPIDGLVGGLVTRRSVAPTVDSGEELESFGFSFGGQ